MRQHALDDAVGAPAVLSDPFEIAGQRRDCLVDLGPFVLVQRGDRWRRGVLQLIQ